MAKHFLTDRDRAIVAEVIRRVRGGAGNNRPLARRRRQVVGGGGGSSTKLVPALVFMDVDAATVDAEEKTVTPGVSDVAACWLLEHAGLADGDYSLIVRQEDDTSGPAPPDGQPWPQKDVARRVLNYSAAHIGADIVAPKLCHGFLQTLTVEGNDVQFFTVMEFVRNSVLYGVTTTAVNGADFTTTQWQIDSGTTPQGTAIAIENDFGFEIPANADFRAEQDDYGNWRLVQSECPI